MESRKRRLADSPWVDDEEDFVSSPRKVARREPKLHTLNSKPKPFTIVMNSPNSRAENSNLESQGTFQDFLANTVPLSLVDDAVKEYLIIQSNKRLAQAREEGVDIEDISIGLDCLPTWPDFFWDPIAEPLHAAVQRRLDHLEVSQLLGNIVRDDIITKGKQKLERARELGLGLHEIIIGDSLLPEKVDLDMEAGHDLESGEQADDSLPSSRTLTPGSSPTPNPEDLLNSSLWGSFARSYGPVTEESGDSSSDSDTDSDSNNDADPDDDFLGISMNNFVDDQAYFSDSSVGFFHDAHVVGAPRAHAAIDFEFYPATEDDEVEDLPEIEFAVDQEAFYHHFETDETIEIEVPGVQFSCTGELAGVEEAIETEVSVEEVETNDGIGEVVNSTTRKVRFAQFPTIVPPSPARTTPRLLDGQIQHDDFMVDLRDDISDASEEVTSDEDEGASIPKEVDGVFSW